MCKWMILMGKMAAACVDQDDTWYGARPQPRRLCVGWEPSPSP